MTTLNDDLILALAGVGLGKNEAAVYLAGLELGPSAIWDIAIKSGVKRPTCYVILEDLAMRGLASSSNDGRRVIYAVASPKQLQRAIERRQGRVLGVINQLEGVASKSPQKPIVRLYEGVAGVTEAYNLSLELKKGQEILIYGTAGVIIKYTDFIDDYLAQRIKQGIKARAILPDTGSSRSVATRDAQELRETRFLPLETFDPTIEINCFADTITYIAHSEDRPFATVIESASLAHLEKQRFELLWNQAKR